MKAHVVKELNSLPSVKRVSLETAFFFFFLSFFFLYLDNLQYSHVEEVVALT